MDYRGKGFQSACSILWGRLASTVYSTDLKTGSSLTPKPDCMHPYEIVFLALELTFTYHSARCLTETIFYKVVYRLVLGSVRSPDLFQDHDLLHAMSMGNWSYYTRRKYRIFALCTSSTCHWIQLFSFSNRHGLCVLQCFIYSGVDWYILPKDVCIW